MAFRDGYRKRYRLAVRLVGLVPGTGRAGDAQPESGDGYRAGFGSVVGTARDHQEGSMVDPGQRARLVHRLFKRSRPDKPAPACRRGDVPGPGWSDRVVLWICAVAVAAASFILCQLVDTCQHLQLGLSIHLLPGRDLAARSILRLVGGHRQRMGAGRHHEFHRSQATNNLRDQAQVACAGQNPSAHHPEQIVVCALQAHRLHIHRPR